MPDQPPLLNTVLTAADDAEGRLPWLGRSSGKDPGTPRTSAPQREREPVCEQAMTATINILLVDDDEDDFLITKALLAEIAGQSYALEWASTADAGLAALEENRHEICLCDYQLGATTGIELLTEAKSLRVQAPIIMLTGLGDRDVDAAAIQAGAADYLVKGQMTSALLERSIRHSLERSRMLKAIKESEERYAIAAQGANDGLWDWNLETDEVYFSPQWKAMLGYDDEEIDHRPAEWFGRLHPEDGQRLEEELESHLTGRTASFETEYRLRTKAGHYRWLLCRGMAVRNASGAPYRMAGWQMDLSSRVASYDALTNLPNRTLFLERLRRAVERLDRLAASKFAVLYIDLDGFKLINDSLGHDVGDLVLIEVAGRLEDALRLSDVLSRLSAAPDRAVERNDGPATDTVARFGGDEFAILLDRIHSLDEAVAVAERVQSLFSKPFTIEGHDFVIGCSIGITMSDAGFASPEDVLRNADIAMYRAKSRGKSRFTVFDTTMHRDIRERVALEADLRRALERDELKVVFQPIVVLATGQVKGVEALLRWNHPELGVIPTLKLIELAEETGLIVPIGAWLLEHGCRLLKGWQRHTPGLTLSVNLSLKQLESPSFFPDLQAIVDRVGVDPSSIIVEVTEGIMIHEHRVREHLENLRALGIGVHLDDFGAGYSSLSRLRQLPIDALKIDRSFIGEMDEGIGIVKAILDLATTVGLSVVAEGVETSTQEQDLLAMRCGFVQGFLFHRPLEAGEVSAILGSTHVSG